MQRDEYCSILVARIYKEIPQRWEGVGRLTRREALIKRRHDPLDSSGKCHRSSEEVDEKEQRKQR